MTHRVEALVQDVDPLSLPAGRLPRQDPRP
jgi:hypothetical protein